VLNELTDGPRWAAFCREYVRQTKGRWAKRPLVPERWQQDLMDEALEIDPATGLRVYSEVVLVVPRKNGKSTIASSASLYFLTSDGEHAPEVYNAAAAKLQAGVVFNQARAFVEASPRLADFVLPRRYHIECPKNGGILRVLSSDAPLQHGLNPSANVIDELHAHKSPDLYVALTTGEGAREQPFTMTITTETQDETSLLGQIIMRALALPDQEQRTPYLTICRDRATGFLMYRYAPPEGADLEDPDVWKGVNPASWITTDYLRRKRNSVTLPYRDFLLYHLDKRTPIEATWLPPGAWNQCLDPAIELDPAQPLHVFIDASLNNDSTAIVAAQKQAGRTPQRAWIWENPYPITSPLRSFWTVPMNEVKDKLRELRREYPIPACKIDDEIRPGPEFSFDPAYFGSEARELDGEGLAMVKFDQTDARMVPASMTYRRLIVEGAIAHDGDPAFAQQINNAIAQPKGYSKFRISKPHGSARRIDACVAGAVSAYRAEEPPPEPNRSRKVVFA
jgi:phage terminase large subunit-like protein